MTNQPRLVVIEAVEPEDSRAHPRLQHWPELLESLPQVLVDAAMHEIPPGPTTVVDVGQLIALTCPRSGGPVHELPLVVSHAVDYLRMESVWNGVDYVFPLAWSDLRAAPMLSGWEIKTRTSPTPRLEMSTPYLMFEAPTLDFLIAIHPAAIRVLVLGLTRVTIRP